MRTTNLLFSAIQFIFVVILFLIGTLFLGLEHAPQIRSSIALFFSESSGNFSSIGYGVIGCAVLLLCGFFAMNRGSYYQIEMHRHLAQVEPEVVRQYIQSYWSEIFPELTGKTDVVFHRKGTIEILAQVPDFTGEELKQLLLQIEEELGLLLSHAFGYRRGFVLTISSS